MSTIRQLKEKEFSEARKLAEEEKKLLKVKEVEKIAMAELAIKQIDECETIKIGEGKEGTGMTTLAKQMVQPIVVNFSVVDNDKVIRKGDHIFIKCSKCGSYKLTTNCWDAKVKQYGSVEMLKEGYICRKCLKK